MYLQKLAFASALLAVANAQTPETSSASSVAAATTVSQSMPAIATAGFNIGNTTLVDRTQWCLAQRNQCPLICGGAASRNECNADNLQYTCICSNGTVPDVSAYEQTVPFYICQQTFVQCTANNPNNAEGQQQCTANEQCGTLNATEVAEAAKSTSGSMATSATSSGSSSSNTASAASSGSSSSSTGSSDASTMTYTTGAMAAVLMAAFKLLL